MRLIANGHDVCLCVVALTPSAPTMFSPFNWVRTTLTRTQPATQGQSHHRHGSRSTKKKQEEINEPTAIFESAGLTSFHRRMNIIFSRQRAAVVLKSTGSLSEFGPESEGLRYQLPTLLMVHSFIKLRRRIKTWPITGINSRSFSLRLKPFPAREVRQRAPAYSAPIR